MRLQLASRLRDLSLVRGLMPIFAHAWFVSFTTGTENFARLSSSTATFQSAAVAGRSLRTCRHISGNFTYRFTLFMLPPSRHISQPARTPSATSQFLACPYTDRDSAQPSLRYQARSRPAPHGKPPP